MLYLLTWLSNLQCLLAGYCILCHDLHKNCLIYLFHAGATKLKDVREVLRGVNHLRKCCNLVWSLVCNTRSMYPRVHCYGENHQQSGTLLCCKKKKAILCMEYDFQGNQKVKQWNSSKCHPDVRGLVTQGLLTGLNSELLLLASWASKPAVN